MCVSQIFISILLQQLSVLPTHYNDLLYMCVTFQLILPQLHRSLMRCLLHFDCFFHTLLPLRLGIGHYVIVEESNYRR